jgi:uncharacterized membrane protein
MGITAVLLAQVFYAIDERIPNEALYNLRITISGEPADLRNILLGMAGTTLATAGVVFTLLTLPLATVAAQFGSRLLRIYLRDRTTQIVLGIFTATVVYCLTTALLIPSVPTEGEPPQLSITVAVLLFLATFSSLIVLIQHISTALQAPNIVAGAAAELRSVIHSLGAEVSPNHTGGQTATSAPAEDFRDEVGYPIEAKGTGYIQSIDPERILHLAQEADLVIRLVKKPGNFVTRGDVVALAWPAEKVDARIASTIGRTFLTGHQRTPTQDVEYAVNQLVEVALRAMSPAINDPFTAMTCLDQLGAGLALFVEQRDPPTRYYDSDGEIRLVFEPASFSELLEACFTMLRAASRNNVGVLDRMLEAVVAINRKVQQDEQRADLRRHVDLILVESQSGNLIDADKAMLRSRCEDLAELLR